MPSRKRRNGGDAHMGLGKLSRWRKQTATNTAQPHAQASRAFPQANGQMEAHPITRADAEAFLTALQEAQERIHSLVAALEHEKPERRLTATVAIMSHAETLTNHVAELAAHCYDQTTPPEPHRRKPVQHV